MCSVVDDAQLAVLVHVAVVAVDQAVVVALLVTELPVFTVRKKRYLSLSINLSLFIYTGLLLTCQMEK